MPLVVAGPRGSRCGRYGLQKAVDQIGVVFLDGRVGECIPGDQIPLMRQVGRRAKFDATAALFAKLDGEAGIIVIGRNDVGLIDLVDRGRSLDPMLCRIELESDLQKPPTLGLEGVDPGRLRTTSKAIEKCFS